uniref:Uncharacterized protein n=1 Tax=Anopheles merus TaxID=30066 RepID=A0A182VDN8_ANOME
MVKKISADACGLRPATILSQSEFDTTVDGAEEAVVVVVAAGRWTVGEGCRAVGRSDSNLIPNGVEAEERWPGGPVVAEPCPACSSTVVVAGSGSASGDSRNGGTTATATVEEYRYAAGLLMMTVKFPPVGLSPALHRR